MLFRTFVIALVLVGTAVNGRSVPQKELFGETPIVKEIILPSRIQIELPAPEAPKLSDEAKNQKIKPDPIVLVEPPEAIAQLIDPVDARPVNPIFLDKKTKPNPVLTEEPEPKVQLVDPLAPRPVHPIYLDKKTKPAPIVPIEEPAPNPVLTEEPEPKVQLIDPLAPRPVHPIYLDKKTKPAPFQSHPTPEDDLPTEVKTEISAGEPEMKILPVKETVVTSEPEVKILSDERQPGEGLGEWFKRTGIQVEPIPELPIPEPVAEPRKQ